VQPKGPTREELAREVAELRSRLNEAEETLRAIRSGEVDALVVQGPQGDQVFSLKGAEQPYRVLIEEMNDGAVTLSADGIVLYANRRLAEMVRLPLERVLGAAFRAFVAPADHGKLEALLQAGRSGRSGGEIAGRADDGTEVPWHLSLNSLPADAPAALCVVATDLTEHKKAAEDLQRAHSELERRVAERTTALARTVQELDASRVAALNMMEDAIAARKCAVQTALALQKEVTERKRAEEALTLQARIANIFLAIPDEEMFNEVLKVILDVMRSPFGVFGYIDEAGALVVPTMTRQIWDKCQVPDKTFVFPRVTWGERSWPRAIREKKANYSNEVSTKAPAGHVTVTRHISLPILFQGEVIGLFQVANKETDYTEADVRTLADIAGQIAPILNARLRRERAQEALRKLNAELEQRVRDRTAELDAANRELEAFSYSVSHDLKAPLRSVDGYARMLEEDYAERLDDEGRRLLRVVRDSARDMGQLINDLLTFSRLSRKDLNFTRLNMRSLADDAQRQAMQNTGGRRLRWEIGELPPAFGDETTIREVWINLLSNAAKFTRPREEATISIAGRTDGDEVVYSVRDNGVGFDMAYKDKLFNVFQRLHTVDEFEGTGIGLALVQRVIQRHRGRVWAEGKVGEGATFCFTLPRGISEQ
jgi:PAS domain S-box-containing protein